VKPYTEIVDKSAIEQRSEVLEPDASGTPRA